MGKKYYIKEFSETFGISTAALRYYEKTGLLSAKRDQNLYRYYTDEDCQKVMNTKVLRSLGFSVNAIKEGKWATDPNVFLNILDEEILNNQKQIENLKLNLQQLDHYKQVFENISKDNIYLGIETLNKSFVFYDQMIKDDLVRPGDPNGITFELYEKMPLTKAVTIIEGISEKEYRQRHGLMIEKDYLPETVSVNQMDECIEVNQCIHILIGFSNSSEEYNQKELEKLTDYAKSLGYSNCNKAICIILPSPTEKNDNILDCYILI